jgi:signal transduction histidine kinase
MSRFVNTGRILPFAAFLFFSSISLVLWQMQIAYERVTLQRHTATTSQQLQIRIEGLVKSRLAALNLLADRWVERVPPDFSQERFMAFSEALFRHYPGFAAINWIDSQGNLQWSYAGDPRETPVVSKNLHHHPTPGYRESFEKARQGLEPSITPTVEIEQGKTGFEVFIPLLHDNSIQGYLNGVFWVEQIICASLPDYLLYDFSIRIFEEDRLVYSSEEAQRASAQAGEQRDIILGERKWQLELERKRDLGSAIYSHNLTFLTFGLLLSAGLSMLFHLLLKKMEMYRKSRDEAIHEVRERAKAEKALRENEEKLERLLAEINTRNSEMESFIYTVSHDLKTPIVTIEGFIGALREDFGDLITKESDRYLQYMSDAALKMESLIGDLLNLSRIGRVNGKREVFPLSEVIGEILRLLEQQIAERCITVHVQQDLPEVYGEKERIAQVVDNLLSNAVKYIGYDNPDPTIEVGFEALDGKNVFFVRDNGIGIEERYFEKVFQIFQRLPSGKRAGNGTGIGLAIVKRVVEHHGGKVWLSSEPGKGSTFFFTLSNGIADHGH